jgi:hypothetical protein
VVRIPFAASQARRQRKIETGKNTRPSVKESRVFCYRNENIRKIPGKGEETTNNEHI